MSDSNMKLWDRVCQTNTAYTKQANNGRFDFTCVDPQYQLQSATKMWGPYGDRWGIKEIKFDLLPSEPPGMMLTGTFYYPADDSKVAEFPIAVDMKYKPGDDCCKKLMTSARSKALSYLGFNADVYLGKFDDAAYVHDLRIKQEGASAFATQALARIKSCKTMSELDKCAARVSQLIANDTVPEEVWGELLSAVGERRERLTEASE